jgi:integrase/recombinase XerC
VIINWQRHTETFLKYMALNRRMSSHTNIAYENDLEQFGKHLADLGILDVSKIKSTHIRAWMAAMLDQGLSIKSIHRKVSSLRACLKWMRRENVITHDPLAKIVMPKMPRKIIQDIPAADLLAMFSRFPWEEVPNGKEDKLLLLMFYSTGMRLSELIGLKVSDIDLKRNSITVLGKRNKMRMIPIHPELAETLENMPMSSSGSLFKLPNGGDLYPVYVYRKVTHYLQLFSNAMKTSPHVLRHSFATHMLNNGAQLLAIKELLGHSSLSATQVYTKNSFEKLKQVHRLHPRS